MQTLETLQKLLKKSPHGRHVGYEKDQDQDSYENEALAKKNIPHGPSSGGTDPVFHPDVRFSQDSGGSHKDLEHKPLALDCVADEQKAPRQKENMNSGFLCCDKDRGEEPQ